MNKLPFILDRHGYFTTQKYLQGKTLIEIERVLGLHEGRLSKGAWFATPAYCLPKPEEFHFAGYSQVPDHKTTEVYGNINSPETKIDSDVQFKLKENIIKTVWSMHGTSRLIKVFPVIPHSAFLDDDIQYPSGRGIPQWKLVVPISWTLISVVNDYPAGRFIP